MKISAMAYLGGKSAFNWGSGRFVAQQLPMRGVYVEPFCGMLGVLLQRPKARFEWANDLDGHIVNWWRVVRDDMDILCERLEYTPYARAEFDRARREHSSEQDPIQRALNTTVLLWQSISKTTADKKCTWAQSFCSARANPAAKIRAIHSRIADVALCCDPATAILEKTARHEDITIYCDPPYHTAPTSDKYNYQPQDEELEQMCDLLLAQKGAVAISGYGDEWDALGWRKKTFSTQETISAKRGTRTEVLWINYPDPAPTLF